MDNVIICLTNLNFGIFSFVFLLSPLQILQRVSTQMYCYIIFKKWVQMVAQQCVVFTWGGRGKYMTAVVLDILKKSQKTLMWLVVSWFRGWKLVCIESAQYIGFLEVLNRLPHKFALVRSSKSCVLDIVHCSISHGVKKKRSCLPQGSIHILLGKPWFGSLEESSIETFISIQVNQRGKDKLRENYAIQLCFDHSLVRSCDFSQVGLSDMVGDIPLTDCNDKG